MHATAAPGAKLAHSRRNFAVDLWDRLKERKALFAAVRNGGWLFADKIFRMGAGLLVGIWVVRYLGPTQLGLLAYAGAFAGLFGTVALLGLDNIVVRELVKEPDRRGEILGTAFALKLVASALMSAAAVIVVMAVRPGDTTVAILVGISAIGFVLQSVNVIDFFFQATVQSKYTVIAASSAFILCTIAKIALLLISASLLGFALIALAEVSLTSAFLLVAYRRTQPGATRWRFDGARARELLSHSWTQIIALIAVVVYMRIDQVMIGQMLGDREVGLFAASVRLSEIWYFIPMGAASSVLPALVAARQNDGRLFLARVQTLYDGMLWLGLTVAIVTTLCAPWLVVLLYGPAFHESAAVLAIQIWAGVFVCLSVMQGMRLIAENLQHYAMYLNVTGALLNVALNLILIPRYGINGAAWATLFAQTIPVVMPLFFKGTRSNLPMMIKSLFAPLRLVLSRSRRLAKR